MNDEAEQYVHLSRDGAQPADARGQAFWRIAAAGLYARRGEFEPAVRVAGEAIATLQQAEDTVSHAYVLQRQSEVLEMAGRDAEAPAAVREAIDLYRRKGATGEVEGAVPRLAELGRAAPGTQGHRITVRRGSAMAGESAPATATKVLKACATKPWCMPCQGQGNDVYQYDGLMAWPPEHGGLQGVAPPSMLVLKYDIQIGQETSADLA